MYALTQKIVKKTTNKKHESAVSHSLVEEILKTF